MNKLIIGFFNLAQGATWHKRVIDALADRARELVVAESIH